MRATARPAGKRPAVKGKRVPFLVLAVAGAVVAASWTGLASAGGASGRVVTRAQVLAETAAVFVGDEQRGGASARVAGEAVTAPAGGVSQEAAAGTTGSTSLETNGSKGAGNATVGVGGQAGAEATGGRGQALGVLERVRGLLVSVWARLQAALSGGTGPAEAATGVTLRAGDKVVADAGGIPPGFRAGVEQAIAAGLVTEADLNEAGLLQPNRPATAAWAAAVLVRALERNAPGVAGSATGTPAIQVDDFVDAAAIPVAYRDEVSTALRLGLFGEAEAVSGASAGRGRAVLRPNAALTPERWRDMLARAAALAGRQLPGELTAGGGAGAGAGTGAGDHPAVRAEVRTRGQAGAGGAAGGGAGARDGGGSTPAPQPRPAGPDIRRGKDIRLEVTGTLVAAPGLLSGDAGAHLRLRTDDGRILKLPVGRVAAGARGRDAGLLSLDLEGLIGRRVAVVIEGNTVVEVRPLR